MPVCISTDVITPVHDALEAAFGSGNTSSQDFDKALIASARKALLDGSNELQFVAAKQSYSTMQEALKEKYTWLSSARPPNQAESTGMSNGKSEGKQGHGSNDDGIPVPRVVIYNSDDINVKWSTMQPARVGLRNMGNTCYMNSILQCLVFTPPLANYLLSGGHAQKCQLKGGGFCVLCKMECLIRKCLGPNTAVTEFTPHDLYANIKMIARHFQRGVMQDAHEFLVYIVEAMQNTCLMGHHNLDHRSKETTPIYRIFAGYLRSQVRCKECHSPSETYDPALNLAVDIKNAASVERGLQKFIQPDILRCDNAYTCERCKKKVEAEKRFTIHRAPPVLTLQLKRFDYQRQFGGKISKHVEFAPTLNLRPYSSKREGDPLWYDLYAVLVHQGFSCSSGHYYCYVRAPNRSWYKMDDSRVSPASLAQVLAAEAYLLFYVRSTRSDHPQKFQQGAAPSASSASSASLVTKSPMPTVSSAVGRPLTNGMAPSNMCRTSEAGIVRPGVAVSASGAVSEILPAKTANGPRTLDGAPLSGKVSFSLTPHGGPRERPRLVMHNPKHSLPGLSAQQLDSQPGAAKHLTSAVQTNGTVDSSQRQMRPLVPYKDDDEIHGQSSDKELPTAAAAAGIARLNLSSGGRSAAVTGASDTSDLKLSSCSKDVNAGLNGSRKLDTADALQPSTLPPSPKSRRHSLGLAGGGSNNQSGVCTVAAAASRLSVNATDTNWHVEDGVGSRPISGRSDHSSVSVRSSASNSSCSSSSSSSSSSSASSTSINSTHEWNVELKASGAGSDAVLKAHKLQELPQACGVPAAAVQPSRSASASIRNGQSAAVASDASVDSKCRLAAAGPLPPASASAERHRDADARAASHDHRGGNASRTAVSCQSSSAKSAECAPGDVSARSTVASDSSAAKSAAAHAHQVGNKGGDVSLADGASVAAAHTVAKAVSAAADRRRTDDGASKQQNSLPSCDIDSSSQVPMPATGGDRKLAEDGGDVHKKKKKRKKHKKSRRASSPDSDDRKRDGDAAGGDGIRRKRRHDDSADERNTSDCESRVSRLPEGSRASSTSVRNESKQKPKHKKRRRHSRSDDDGSSGSEQWVEITKANLADKKLLGQATAHGNRHNLAVVASADKQPAAATIAIHNGSGDRLNSVRSGAELAHAVKWDGTKKSSVTHLLEKQSLFGYGTSVSGWDGAKSRLNREVEEERKHSRKRTWHDDYEEELDRGRTKKVKGKHDRRHHHSPSDYNKLQHLQDIRNHSSGRSDKWRHDQESSRSTPRPRAY